ILMMPWKLLGSFSSYIFGWLIGYSGLLGPIAGVMIADYYVYRHCELAVDDLYRRGGRYEYCGGVNSRAMWSLAPGLQWPWPGWPFRRYAGCTITPGSSDFWWRAPFILR